MNLTKEWFLEKIKAYNLDRNIWDEKAFWLENKDWITKLVEWNVFNQEEFSEIKNAMDIFRWKYLMNCRYMTIDKDYQDICRLFIALTFQKRALWIKNYLRYFDPNTAYYKRVYALDLFRNLDNPKEEIEDLLPIVWKTLVEAAELEPEWIFKTENIFKEYIERIFTLTRLDIESRTDFLIISDEYLDYFYANTDLNEWVLNIINDDAESINEPEEIEEETDSWKEEVIEPENVEPVIDNEKIELDRKNKEQTQIIENLQKVSDEKDSVISELKKKIESIQKWAEDLLNAKTIEIDQLVEELNQVRKENVDSKIKNLEKENELEHRIELMKWVIKDLNEKANKIEETKSKLEENSTPLLTIKQPLQEIVEEKISEKLLERRKYYRIIVVWGSEKMIRKFKKELMNDKELESFMNNEYWLQIKQFELEWDYDKQSDKDFAKKIENDLIFDRVNFVLAVHTDHNTGLNNLIKDSNYTTRITVFWEREEKNANPKYWQNLSLDSFKYYVKRALDKYERDLINSNM